MDNINKNLAALEAILFAYGEPMSKKKIGGLLNLKKDEVSGLIEEFAKQIEKEERGVCLIVSEDQVQLATKPAFGNLLASFVKEELNENLTPVALETLALVAYFEPISRVKIDYIRGVNSSFILRNLMIRGLVERFSDPQSANAFLYQTSFNFKKYLGVDKKENLPEYQKFQELLQKFESSQEVASDKQTNQAPAPITGDNPSQDEGE
jgi:segregation and condensation protein B